MGGPGCACAWKRGLVAQGTIQGDWKHGWDGVLSQVARICLAHRYYTGGSIPCLQHLPKMLGFFALSDNAESVRHSVTKLVALTKDYGSLQRSLPIRSYLRT